MATEAGDGTARDGQKGQSAPGSKKGVIKVKGKGVCRAIYGNPSHNYGVSLAVWDHTVLPTTRHKRIHPAFTPARQAGTRFTDHLRGSRHLTT